MLCGVIKEDTMIRHISKLSLAFLLCFTLNSSVFAHGSKSSVMGDGVSGGGSIFNPSLRSAWFIKDGDVSYCVAKDYNFPQTEDAIHQIIQYSFHKWQNYFVSKGWGSYNLRLERNDRCQGDEDMTFYMGGKPDAIEDEVDGFATAVAFTHVKSMSTARDWKKGFVYFRNPDFTTLVKRRLLGAVPDWKNLSNVSAMMLHEVGHIMGVAHVEGTVMKSTIAQELSTIDSYRKVFSLPSKGYFAINTSKINEGIEYLFNGEIEHEYRITNRKIESFSDEENSTSALISVALEQRPKILFGNEKSIKSFAGLIGLSTRTSFDDMLLTFEKSKLFLSVDKKKYRLSLDFSDYVEGQYHSSGFVSSHILNRTILDTDGSLVVKDRLLGRLVQTTKFGTAIVGSKRYPVVYKINQDGISDEIKIYLSGKWRVLFSTGKL